MHEKIYLVVFSYDISFVLRGWGYKSVMDGMFQRTRAAPKVPMMFLKNTKQPALALDPTLLNCGRPRSRECFDRFYLGRMVIWRGKLVQLMSSLSWSSGYRLKVKYLPGQTAVFSLSSGGGLGGLEYPQTGRGSGGPPREDFGKLLLKNGI